MDDFKVGDVVIRKSHGGDVYFKIVQINHNLDGEIIYILKGTNLRLVADSPGDDLKKVNTEEFSIIEDKVDKRINERIKKILIKRKIGGIPEKGLMIQKQKDGALFGESGKVLHLDGDEEYLSICLKGYKQLGVDAIGKPVSEVKQPEVVSQLLKEYKPDILVLTGHDGMIKGSQNFKNIDSYRNSRYFIQAVKNARNYQSSYDELVIFAGACQSFYEGLIAAGANFASSPYRVLIHALDPVFLCEKIAYSSIGRFLSAQEVLEHTISGEKGIGGFETRGKFREGTPKSPYA